MARKLAAAESIAKYLSDLTGRAVTAEPGKPTTVPLPAGMVVATYVEAGGQVGALCLCDVGAAASLGGALTMVGPALVKDSVKAQKVDGVLLENYHEVCNVLTRVVNASSDVPQLALGELIEMPAALPEAVAALIGKSAARIDTTIAVAGYAGGYLGFVST